MRRAVINWRMNIVAKRGKGSQTPGKTKGERCTTDAQKKFFFTSPKAYKHRDYDRWHKVAYTYNGMKPPT